MTTSHISARTRMRERYAFYIELARAHEAAGRCDAAWASLEAAHIVGQRSTRLHVSSHTSMLGLAWRTRDTTEIVGQFARLIGGAVITWLWVPSGNTGRSNISALRSLPIPQDLR